MPESKAHIKEIIARFLRKNPEAIDVGTNLNISSVLKHRMYAALAEKGFHIRDRHEVRNLGDLLRKVHNRVEPTNLPLIPAGPKDLAPAIQGPLYPESDGHATSLGIDIQMGVDLEDVDNLPEVSDFRKDEFYTRTFSNREISYCLLQENPRPSFAGKFAAKEAIIKTDPAYGRLPMNKIEILNDIDGKPYFENFKISISHTEHSAVAVVMRPILRPLDSMLNPLSATHGAELPAPTQKQ
jgi:holo-[acyl-carrier protein] synthase